MHPAHFILAGEDKVKTIKNLQFYIKVSFHISAEEVILDEAQLKVHFEFIILCMILNYEPWKKSHPCQLTLA